MERIATFWTRLISIQILQVNIKDCFTFSYAFYYVTVALKVSIKGAFKILRRFRTGEY